MNSYEKNKQHILNYQKKNIRQISLKLTMNTDADIIEHLDKQDNIQGYIKGLIRKDMKKMTAEEIIENGLYNAAVMLMDDEIRESIHMNLDIDDDLEFLETYMEKHKEKYGTDFVI